MSAETKDLCRACCLWVGEKCSQLTLQYPSQEGQSESPCSLGRITVANRWHLDGLSSVLLSVEIRNRALFSKCDHRSTWESFNFPGVFLMASFAMDHGTRQSSHQLSKRAFLLSSIVLDIPLEGTKIMIIFLISHEGKCTVGLSKKMFNQSPVSIWQFCLS